MKSISLTLLSSTAAIALATIPLGAQTNRTSRPTPPVEGETVRGEDLSPFELGPSWVETMDDVVRRESLHLPAPGVQCVPEPESPFQEEVDRQKRLASRETGGHQTLGGGGSIPVISTNFVGPRQGDAGGGWLPPDTCGAVGPNHFMSIVNANVSIWNKFTGARLTNVSEQSFFASGTSLGDGRVVYDPHHSRFILIGDAFNSGSRIYLAVSATSDPTGAWFKTSFTTNGGTDAGTWPDYPTLGVDANGVYMGVYAVGGFDTMTIFALDKAPLVAAVQTLGTITAFRQLNWEGAIQPCVTYGASPGEYCITYGTIYRVNAPSPFTLTNLGGSDVSGGSPPNAPNLNGSGLDTLDARLMNAVYRNGRIWTTHAVGSGGRSAVRWYEIDPTISNPVNRAVQTGTIDDPTRHYFAPGISVNAGNAMVVGFTGSSSSQFAAAYVAGRKPTDPAGQACAPIQIKAGEAGYNDGRWGDYSLTSVDPSNDIDFWTIQEYARSGGIWGTWIAKVIYDSCIPVTPANFCTGAPNSAGPGADMSWSGSNSIAQNNFVLQTFGAPPNKTCLYMYSQNQSVNVVFGNGFRCIGNPLFRLNPLQTTDFIGDVSRPLDLNNLPLGGDISAGQSWGFMLWYRDFPAGGAFYNASDALSTTWCP